MEPSENSQEPVKFKKAILIAMLAGGCFGMGIGLTSMLFLRSATFRDPEIIYKDRWIHPPTTSTTMGPTTPFNIDPKVVCELNLPTTTTRPKPKPRPTTTITAPTTTTAAAVP